MIASRHLRATLRAHLSQRASSWSIGGYGAIAEFHWLPDDRPGNDSEILQVVTGAGALSLELRDGVVPHAYQGLSRHPDRWLQGISLCLPWRRARCGARTVLTELGPDLHAICPGDRGAVLFDMGLGLPHVDACVRTDSPELLKCLRAGCGQPVLAPGNGVMPAVKEASPHRVFVSQLGRVEVYQRIGDPAHHPATRACATLYPQHPLMDNLGNPTAYDRGAHARFTALMERWGDAAFLVEKKRATRAMRAGVDARRYRAPADAKGRHAVRIAIRELAQQIGDTDAIDDWRSRFDRVRPPSHPHLVH
jgi:hypothetical protein